MVYFLSSRVFNSLAYVQGILTTLSQSNGKYKYDYATIPFLAELFKVHEVYAIVYSDICIS
jgi:UDP-sugar transporter A1/2/3